MHVEPLVILQGHETYQQICLQNTILMTDCFNLVSIIKDAYDKGNGTQHYDEL